jgi:hypothetical protein
MPPPVTCSPREPPLSTTTYTCKDVFLPYSPFPTFADGVADPANYFLPDMSGTSPFLADSQPLLVCPSYCNQDMSTSNTAYPHILTPSPSYLVAALPVLATSPSLMAAVAAEPPATCDSCYQGGLPELALSPQPSRICEDAGGEDDFDRRAVSESAAPVMC